MKPRISVITLGVDDLERAVGFYRDGLGWPTEGIVGTELEEGGVAFFDLQPGLKLALYPRVNLAQDAGVALERPGPASGASASAAEGALSHNVASREEVDAVMAQACAAGARLTKAARMVFWGGYAGYFQDPDGHLWEVAWNPKWPLPDD
ncbi:VOC family protein [Thauera sp. WH-1]|uniref:VOC family protein n=1 Tax=Thauera sp. WH-1 TaxID=3398230 RepID=UPI0039FD3674